MRIPNATKCIGLTFPLHLLSVIRKCNVGDLTMGIISKEAAARCQCSDVCFGVETPAPVCTVHSLSTPPSSSATPHINLVWQWGLARRPRCQRSRHLHLCTVRSLSMDRLLNSSSDNLHIYLLLCKYERTSHMNKSTPLLLLLPPNRYIYILLRPIVLNVQFSIWFGITIFFPNFKFKCVFFPHSKCWLKELSGAFSIQKKVILKLTIGPLSFTA